ncbi:MAG: hydroxyacylglutathione hydrolase [Sandaracinus sp.]|nr:hydroxyacylglutathione hydrolase [Sandaracinus sp.]
MEHVVTRPREPFTSADGRLEVHQIPSWKDNLIWLVVCKETGEATAVDGPEAAGVLAYCEEHGFRLTQVLNTHTHPDHVGINRDLEKRGLLDEVQVVGPGRKAEAVPGIDRGVDEGDEVMIGTCTGRVLLTEGHIDGHVSYVFDDLLFCGDTLFGAGCGYLFDGPPAKMHASLEKLATLPADTKVCCAHEYTEDNLRFAWTVEPDNEALAQRIREVWALRARGECSVPSTMGEERATNPFLRTSSATLRDRVAHAMERVLESDGDVFAATRALKDRKDYKTLADQDLPVG